MLYTSYFQPFSSYGIYKLINKILQRGTPKNIFFADLTKKKDFQLRWQLGQTQLTSVHNHIKITAKT